MEWHDISKEAPQKDKDMLVYTDDGKMKVAMFHRGIWNTYMNVLYYCELPEPPHVEPHEEQTKRGRKKKV